uniref:BRI1 kinase inhibitor 1 n=1 Tax=Oryza rufipogon TaxID=4529 RepID=A0A0E0QK80_ORYRU
MSSPVRRVGSDLSSGIYSAAASHGHQQQTTSDNGHGSANDDDDDDVAKAKQRLSSLLFSGVGTWRRSVDGSGGDSKRQVKGNSSRGGGGGLDIAQLVKKYASMVERLFFASSLSNNRRRGGGDQSGRRTELRRRRHSFIISGLRRGAAAAAAAPSKRHEGSWLFSAPASLRGSPVASGHLSVKVSTSSEESTMEELHSAVQAAIAHCKNSIAAAAPSSRPAAATTPTGVNADAVVACTSSRAS